MVQELRNKIGHMLWRVQQASSRFLLEESGELEITPVQYIAIFVLSKRPRIDQKTLASLIALDPSTTASVLARLEDKGLVVRELDEHDRRARVLQLSKRGQALADALIPVARRTRQRILAPLSSRERPEFVRMLRKMSGLADRSDEAELPRYSSASRLSGKSVLLVGSSSQSVEIVADKLTSEAAHVTQVAFEGRRGSYQLSRYFARLESGHAKLDAVVNVAEPASTAAGSGRNENGSGDCHAVTEARLAALKISAQCLARLQGGQVITLGLVPDFYPAQSLVSVAAANLLIEEVTQELSWTSRQTGVVCRSVCPRIDTHAVLQTIQDGEQELAEPEAERSIARLAAIVAFLISDESAALCGENFPFI